MANEATSNETVVLLPGLWMPAWAMIPLQRRLAYCGFRTLRVGYASASAGLRQNAECVAEAVRRLGAARVHLVGHSLGGVVALHAALRFGLSNVQRIVMIGSPYGDSHAARKLARSAFGRWMMGPCVPEWLACDKDPIPPTVEVAVIAGSVAFGLGVLIARDLPRPNDGLISVGETQVAGMKASTIIPVSHSYMLLSTAVARLSCRFLRTGTFERAHANELASTA